MIQPGRNFNSSEYRFGFNGKESDDELKGTKNSYDFGARIYDPRIGSFLSIDPLWKIFPYQSPYVFALNNPIRFIDIDGEGPGDGVQKLFVTKITIETKNGDQTVYLKKRYYENVTPAQVKRYEKAAITSGGWYYATAAEYEQYQKNPDQGAFSTRVYGADTPETIRIFNNGDTQTGGDCDEGGEHVFELENLKETILITADQDEDVQVNLYGVDQNGNKRSLGSTTVPASSQELIDVELEAGERVNFDAKGNASYHIYSKARKGDRVPDNMAKHEKERPKPKDKKEITNDLKNRKG